MSGTKCPIWTRRYHEPRESIPGDRPTVSVRRLFLLHGDDRRQQNAGKAETNGGAPDAVFDPRLLRECRLRLLSQPTVIARHEVRRFENRLCPSATTAWSAEPSLSSPLARRTFDRSLHNRFPDYTCRPTCTASA